MVKKTIQLKIVIKVKQIRYKWILQSFVKNFQEETQMALQHTNEFQKNNNEKDHLDQHQQQENMIQDLVKKIADLEADNIQIKNENQILQNNFEQEKVLNAQLQETQKQKYYKLQEKNSSYYDEKQSLRETIEDLKTKLTDKINNELNQSSEKQEIDAKIQYFQLQDEIKSLRETIEDLNTKLADKINNELIQNSEMQEIDVNQQNSQPQDEIKSLKKTIEVMNEKQIDLETNLQKAQDKEYQSSKIIEEMNEKQIDLETNLQQAQVKEYQIKIPIRQDPLSEVSQVINQENSPSPQNKSEDWTLMNIQIRKLSNDRQESNNINEYQNQTNELLENCKQNPELSEQQLQQQTQIIEQQHQNQSPSDLHLSKNLETQQDQNLKCEVQNEENEENLEKQDCVLDMDSQIYQPKSELELLQEEFQTKEQNQKLKIDELLDVIKELENDKNQSKEPKIALRIMQEHPEQRRYRFLVQFFDDMIFDKKQMVILSHDRQYVIFFTFDGSVKQVIYLKDQKSQFKLLEEEISIERQMNNHHVALLKEFLGVVITWNQSKNQTRVKYQCQF